LSLMLGTNNPDTFKPILIFVSKAVADHSGAPNTAPLKGKKNIWQGWKGLQGTTELGASVTTINRFITSSPAEVLLHSAPPIIAEPASFHESSINLTEATDEAFAR
jgi:hypothetical protein